MFRLFLEADTTALGVDSQLSPHYFRAISIFSFFHKVFLLLEQNDVLFYYRISHSTEKPDFCQTPSQAAAALPKTSSSIMWLI